MERTGKMVKVNMPLLTQWCHAREKRPILPLFGTRLEGGGQPHAPVALSPEKEPQVTIKQTAGCFPEPAWTLCIRNTLLPIPGIKLWFLRYPTRSLIITTKELPQPKSTEDTGVKWPMQHDSPHLTAHVQWNFQRWRDRDSFLNRFTKGLFSTESIPAVLKPGSVDKFHGVRELGLGKNYIVFTHL